MISSERTADRTFEPVDELITLSIVVVGALTTALGARTVVVDVDATVVVTEVVVGRVVVVVVVRGRVVVVTGGSVSSGATAGPTAVVAGGNVVGAVVVGAAVVAGGRVVVVLDVELVVVVVVLGSGGCANAGAAKTLPSNSSAKVNPARTRVLVGDDRRLTGSSSD
jgi:hypothetical protein